MAISEAVPEKRIAVTGVGLVGPLGDTSDVFFSNLLDGQSGIREFENAPLSGVMIAGEAVGFSPEERLGGIVPKKDMRSKLSRASMLALAATDEALKMSEFNGGDTERVGVVIGTSFGGVSELPHLVLKLHSRDRISPHSPLLIEHERPATVISEYFNLHGSADAISAACASGNRAIEDAAKRILLGEVDVMVTGGVDSMLTDEIMGVYLQSKALSSSSDISASRPFDDDASGFVMSEGAGILILEDWDFAKRRGIRPIAELLSYSSRSDVYHPTQPSAESQVKVMERAIRQSGGMPSEGVVYINPHATSTIVGDKAEATSLVKVFAGYEEEVRVSSTKGAVGHVMGGAGGVEAVICVLSIDGKIMPPNLNLEKPILEASGLNMIRGESQRGRVERAVNNSFGFGGQSSTVVFGAV